ncbi:MAG: hypothetical protein L6W00_18730 [Lentisphaeria bacterium]|nr:MAG: hypothetical protein L6W00_18730 [Lentisphaeria bacterium]
MIFRSAGAGKAQGIDLFAPGSESFRAIERAVERMLKSYLDPAEKWPYPLLNGELEPGAFANVVLQYHAWTKSESAGRALARLPEKNFTLFNRIFYAPTASAEE